MADVTIAATGSTSAPLSYTVAGAQEIIIRSLFASFDGTGAAGAFLPCVQVVSPAGQVVIEAITDASVAAGSSADVTFAPFLRPGGGGSSAASLSFGIAYRNNFDIPTVPTGSGANFDPWDSFDVTGSDLSLNGSGQIAFGTQGLYLCTVGLQVDDSTWLGTDTMNFNFQLLTGGLSNQISGTWPGKTTSVAPNNPSGAARVWEVSAQVWVNIKTPTEATRQQVLSVTGGGAHTATSTFAVCSVLRVGDYATGGVT